MSYSFLSSNPTLVKETEQKAGSRPCSQWFWVGCSFPRSTEEFLLWEHTGATRPRCCSPSLESLHKLGFSSHQPWKLQPLGRALHVPLPRALPPPSEMPVLPLPPRDLSPLSAPPAPPPPPHRRAGFSLRGSELHPLHPEQTWPRGGLRERMPKSWLTLRGIQRKFFSSIL